MKSVPSVTQFASTQRAFSILASKIHPQLPLSKRESEQLLNLLTTSFRRQLDQEHPLDTPNHKMPQKRKATGPPANSQLSAQGLAGKHIGSILTNPLFAVKPTMPAALKNGDAETVFKNPLAWFMSEIAGGTADLGKASTCLDLVKGHDNPLKDSQGRGPGAVIAQWLTDSRQPFLGDRIFIKHLTRQLVREDREDVFWQWFKYPERLPEPEAAPAVHYRGHLLAAMVAARVTLDKSLSRATDLFLTATGLRRKGPDTVLKRDLCYAGLLLCRHILSRRRGKLPLKQYDLFLEALWSVTFGWSQLFPALLQLQHPVKPDAAPGLLFLQREDLTGMPTHTAPRLTELTLGVAHQLLSEGKYADAQWALDCAQHHFPHLSFSSPPEDVERTMKTLDQLLEPRKVGNNERKSLELLDRLSIA